MKREFEALETNNTWDLMELPPGKRPISCKWGCKVKHKADGTIERCKTRLVVQGYTQNEGINYTKTFSPMIKMTTRRFSVATTAKNVVTNVSI